MPASLCSQNSSRNSMAPQCRTTAAGIYASGISPKPSSDARKREIALRLALGAGQRRVLRQMLTESLVLSLSGGVLGVAAAFACLLMLVRFIPEEYLATAASLLTLHPSGV